jgi:hypothetical protein
VPFCIWNSVVRVPHSFEDDLFLLMQNSLSHSFNTYIKNYINSGGSIRILDFHPIHIFLNTESIDRYERTRNIHSSPKELIDNRYVGEGIRTAFETLLGLH